MKVETTDVAGVKIVEPDVFTDARGYFCETDNRARYAAAGIDWPDIGVPLTLSEKDRRHPLLVAIEPWSE